MLAAIRSVIRRLFTRKPQAKATGESDPMYMGETVSWVKTSATGERTTG